MIIDNAMCEECGEERLKVHNEKVEEFLWCEKCKEGVPIEYVSIEAFFDDDSH